VHGPEIVDQRLSAHLNQPIRLKPEEWTSGDITWIVEAVGAPQAMGPLLKSLAERELKGNTIKMRGRDDQGRPVVRVIDPSNPVAPEKS
jgi:hemolysin-activating ACP:hemolysin acyltransferase